MITLHLKPLLEARGIEDLPAFLRENGFSRSAISILMYTQPSHLNLKYLEKLCKALHCTPNDLLLWVKDKSDYVPEDHPLHELRKKVNIPLRKEFNELRKLPLHQLEEVVKAIKQKGGSKPIS